MAEPLRINRKAIRLYNRGKTPAQIARTFGISRQRVYEYVARARRAGLVSGVTAVQRRGRYT